MYAQQQGQLGTSTQTLENSASSCLACAGATPTLRMPLRKRSDCMFQIIFPAQLAKLCSSFGRVLFIGVGTGRVFQSRYFHSGEKYHKAQSDPCTQVFQVECLNASNKKRSPDQFPAGYHGHCSNGKQCEYSS